MLRSAYKHFSSLNLAEVTSKNDSKPFKVAPVDGTLKQMKQKRSLGNVVHLFLRLLILLNQVLKKQRRMKKKWCCAGR